MHKTGHTRRTFIRTLGAGLAAGVAGLATAADKDPEPPEDEPPCPNFIIMESIGDMQGFHGELLKEPIEWKQGYIIPSTRPGIGYELDEAVARKHQWPIA